MVGEREALGERSLGKDMEAQGDGAHADDSNSWSRLEQGFSASGLLTFQLDNSLLCVAVLGIAGCLPELLASTQ